MQFAKILIFIFIQLIVTQIFAVNCDTAKMLSHPDLAKNAKFWEELASLNNPSDSAIKSLIEKHQGLSSVNPTQISSVSSAKITDGVNVGGASSMLTSERVSLARSAQKSVEELPEHIRGNFDKFVQTVNSEGANGLYKQPGKWRPEKYRNTKNNFDGYSARLDRGYRVIFKIDENNLVRVIDIGNEYH